MLPSRPVHRLLGLRPVLVGAVVAPSLLLSAAVSGSARATAAATARAPQEASEESPAAAAWQDTYILPNESVQELFTRDKNYATLDRPSPDGRHFAIPVTRELATLERTGRPTLRLAMLELRPHVERTWGLDTYGMIGVRVYDLETDSTQDVPLPEDVFVSDLVWSPSGDRIAFLVHGPERSEVWWASASTGRAERVSDAPVMATLATDVRRFGSSPSDILQWRGEDALVTLLVPRNRGPEPTRGLARGPIVRRTRDTETPTPTYPFLLRDATDAELFRYHTTSQIAELSPGRAPRPLGEPGMFESLSLSPDGAHLLSERIVEPLSPIVGYRSFGRVLEVRDVDGSVLRAVRERPLQEGSSRGGDDPGRDLPREVQWLPDGSGLAWLQRVPRPHAEEADDGGAAEQTEAPEEHAPVDRILTLAAPFAAEPVEVRASEDAMSDLAFTADAATALVGESRDGKSVLVAVSAADGSTTDLVDPWDPEDPLVLPGDPVTRADGNGTAHLVTSTDGNAVWLQGPGYAEDFRPRPFLDRVPLTGGGSERVFEGAADSYERPLVLLDDDARRLIVERESKTDFPDSWLWDRDAGFVRDLTGNVDPFPEITAARRIDFEFSRRDGLTVQARISLPVGYRAGDRVPAMFWTYPSEYESAKDYRRDAIRERNHNAFTHLSYLRWSDIWLAQGYALVYPDVPIVGDPYNDNYIQDLDDTLYAAIREVDRRGWVDPDRVGHGGHSYGAFATGNLLAHTPYFRAGIAGDGAYNRTLTPMGFQRERRFLWQAADTYLEMSPFFQADHIDTPLLMYHGADDNNTGTFPIQSFRMIQALTGLGKNAVLYVYPYESHGPRARETYLDLWARWLDWFDRYVKDADAPDAGAGRDGEPR